MRCTRDPGMPGPRKTYRARRLLKDARFHIYAWDAEGEEVEALRIITELIHCIDIDLLSMEKERLKRKGYLGL